MGADPIGQLLCPGGFSKGVVGGAEYGNEELRMTDFPRQPVNDRQVCPA